MDLFNTIKISSTALKAQQIRLNTVSSNLANAETTQTPEGGPYKRKTVVFQSDGSPFSENLDQELRGSVQGVKVTSIMADQAAPRIIYNPGHPDANEEGYVSMPNINVLEEMADMVSATRAYEANINTIQASKRMALKALEIGK
ncbi:MAG: flagellar basal body rod protein FlgC [Deltaproteobacteria bacterium]|nr:flagellar basal body rod protein FlgC [Deltaproteobacteria bacterium]